MTDENAKGLFLCRYESELCLYEQIISHATVVTRLVTLEVIWRLEYSEPLEKKRLFISSKACMILLFL